MVSLGAVVWPRVLPPKEINDDDGGGHGQRQDQETTLSAAMQQIARLDCMV